MNDFLTKPFKPEDLYEMVDRWMHGITAAEADDPTLRSATQTEVASPPVDIESFRAVMREAGVEEIVDSAVGVYVEETPKVFERFRLAVADGDAEEARVHAHALKGSSANVRANRLADLLERAELLSEARDAEALTSMMPDVEAEYERVLGYLKSTQSA